MRSILVTVPDTVKAQLDYLRAKKGFSLVGFCRTAIAAALAAEYQRRTGAVSVRYRKQGGQWKHRRIPAPSLEQEVFRLEAQGAECHVGEM